jgi:hypothetical protein
LRPVVARQQFLPGELDLGGRDPGPLAVAVGRRAAIRPTLMPRKQARSTMLVKKARNTTIAPNQRIAASSKNRIRKLKRNRSRRGPRAMEFN